MIAQSVVSEKDIVITAADFDRLQDLLNSPRYRSTQRSLLLSLREELDRGQIVPADAVPEGVVTMHSTVRVRDVKARASETYELVYPDEANINENKLSVLAPLGMALLGTRVGQIVRFDAPAGPRRLKIEEILYQPESAGDFHL
jgi:regulator of nucleoside diphosphate kinase